MTNTITSMLEYQAAYVRQVVEHIAKYGGAYSVSKPVHDRFNAELERPLQGTVFTAGCPGWYSTASGRIITVWAGSHTEYRRRLEVFDPNIYDRVEPADHAHTDRPVSTTASK